MRYSWTTGFKGEKSRMSNKEIISWHKKTELYKT